MKDIAIYGFGGFGREVACVIAAINEVNPTWNLIGYFDDGFAIGEKNKYAKVIGGINELNQYPKDLSIILAIASPAVLQKILSLIQNDRIDFPNIIAPNVLFFDRDSVNIGRGNLITFGSRISCNVSIGDFNLVNGCVSFGHDVKIGDFNVFQPEVRISGETLIGNQNFFGVRSLVLQGLTIGDGVRLGTYSVIMRKPKDGMSYFGNPAKMIKF